MGWLIFFVIIIVIILSSKKKKENTATYKNNQDNLSNFKINISTNYSTSHLNSYTKSKNKAPGRWIKPGESVKVGTFEINGGFFYFGGKLDSLDNYSTEASLVDHTLKLNTTSPDYIGEHMGYWPSYENITPESRAAYIEWLAGDRSNPETNIGYIFLYFYGIERRLLIDSLQNTISEDEYNSLIIELNRLKIIFANNRSFDNYVSSLLSHVRVLNYKGQNKQLDQKLLFGHREFTSFFKFRLANIVNGGELLPEDLALAWVRSHPEYSLRTPARRCENEFNTLFKIRYNQMYGEGLIIKPNKTRLQIHYHSASSSLRGYQALKFDLPDPSRLKAPVTKLMTIAETCTEELVPFSRYVGKADVSRDSIIAITLLPKDILQTLSNPILDEVKIWINNKISKSNGLATIEEFIKLFGEEAPEKINKKEALMLVNIVEKSGFGMVPDIRYHQAKPEITGKIAFFPGGHGEEFSPSHVFSLIGTILRLGSIVAVIDNNIHESEVTFLQNIIQEEPQLSEIEKKSMNAYLFWRLHTPVSMTGIKARIDEINDLDKAAISHILISVALADGKIVPSEIKQLEKLYISLGLDKSMVTSDIHNISTNKLISTIPYISDTRRNISENSKEKKSSFNLNRDLLKIHEEETVGVQAILESIFIDDNFIDEPENNKLEQTLQHENGLDDKHHKLYSKLIKQNEWMYDDVKIICDELQLMVDGAIEVINDWAFDQVDAPIIDSGNTIFIDQELVEEIKIS